jgi:hypothetical protein
MKRPWVGASVLSVVAFLLAFFLGALARSSEAGGEPNAPILIQSAKGRHQNPKKRHQRCQNAQKCSIEPEFMIGETADSKNAKSKPHHKTIHHHVFTS